MLAKMQRELNIPRFQERIFRSLLVVLEHKPSLFVIKNMLFFFHRLEVLKKVEIINLVVKQNKKGKFYTVKFELNRDNNITKNWTTIAREGNKYIFNSVIYKIDPDKAVFSNNTVKSPDPEFYYNASLSEKVFNLTLKSQDFTQNMLEVNEENY